MQKNAYALTLLLLLFPLTGCLGSETGNDVEDNDDTEEIDLSNKYAIDYRDVLMKVTHDGETYQFTIQLNLTAAPMHTDSFQTHVLEGNYISSTFHRIISEFMIQAGDFENGDGTGGYAANWYGICEGIESTIEDCSDQSSWNIPSESDNGLMHLPCTVSMARASSPDSGGSQFFIVPSDSTPDYLDGGYTVFGIITEGCEDVTALSKVPTDGGAGSDPISDVVIISTELSDGYSEYFDIPETIDRCDILSLATEDIDGDGGFELIGTYQERLNFTNCNLAGLDFSGLTFHYVDFSDSNLSSVQFSDSSLTNVLFNNVVLDEANFDSASLEYGVQVVNSSMNEASFKLTYMSNFWVKQSNITNVDLSTSIIDSAAFIDIDVCPLLLPSEWHCLNKNLIGPNAWLMEADLSNLNLDGINLTGSSMRGTNLSNTHLSNSIMTEVMAQEIMQCPLSLPSEWLCINNVLMGPTARLNYADLGDLDLSSQNLSGMIISHSNLTGTDFSNSNMSGVTLWRTLMKNSNFSNTNLANFEGKQLLDCPEDMPIEWVCKPSGSIFRPASWSMPYDSRSGLTQVEFTETYYEANLTIMFGPQALITGFDSDYIHLDLSNVNLSGAIIEDSNFNGVNLSSADLNGTVWMNTICPNGEYSDLHGQSCEGQLEFSDAGTENDP